MGNMNTVILQTLVSLRRSCKSYWVSWTVVLCNVFPKIDTIFHPSPASPLFPADVSPSALVGSSAVSPVPTCASFFGSSSLPSLSFSSQLPIGLVSAAIKGDSWLVARKLRSLPAFCRKTHHPLGDEQNRLASLPAGCLYLTQETLFLALEPHYPCSSWWMLKRRVRCTTAPSLDLAQSVVMTAGKMVRSVCPMSSIPLANTSLYSKWLLLTLPAHAWRGLLIVPPSRAADTVAP